MHPLALDKRAPIPYEWPLEARNKDVVVGEVMIYAALIFGFIASGWFALAAYIGVTVFLATTFPRPWIFFFTSLVILGATTAFVIDQEVFDQFYRYRISFADGHSFWAANFLLNASFGAGTGLSLMKSRRLPLRLGGFVRAVCWLALICSVPWIMDGQGDGIFLARLYVPDDEFIFSRLVFVPLFAAVALVAFLWSNILYRKGVSP